MTEKYKIFEEKIDLLEMQFDNLGMNEAIEKIKTLIENKQSSMIFTPNVHRLIYAKKDKYLDEIYHKADLLIPDGTPIIWASRLLGEPLKERVAGSDLLPLFCQIASKKGYRLFFLGAEEGVAEEAAKILTKKNPGLKIVGTYSPPLGFENDAKEIEKIIGLINAKKADLLFLGLGFPKEEIFLWRYKDRLQVSVSIGIGATFDFVAGKRKRAPRWTQNMGMEWFYRLWHEPRRLWKRYLIGNTIFIWLVIKELVKKK